MATWDGEDYQRRIAELSRFGGDPHGEANLVMALEPRTVLDAGCGTGRVAIELARRGVEVVGLDADPSMLATARRLAPELTWIEAPLHTTDLGRTFDLVLMAGNVPLFTPEGTTAELLVGCARHLEPGGALLAGFSLDHRYGIGQYDDEAEAAGLHLEDRYATWEGATWSPEAGYAVSLHRRGRPAAPRATG
jgi:SAM-dependent methyltransferase